MTTDTITTTGNRFSHRARLARIYYRTVGYNPIDDDPTTTTEAIRTLLRELLTLMADDGTEPTLFRRIRADVRHAQGTLQHGWPAAHGTFTADNA